MRWQSEYLEGIKRKGDVGQDDLSKIYCLRETGSQEKNLLLIYMAHFEILEYQLFRFGCETISLIFI
jgi:hypothetical protein